MRKLLIGSAIAMALGFGFSMATVERAEAKTRCWYECGCNGEALYCCRTGGIVLCKVVIGAPIECPQIADC